MGRPRSWRSLRGRWRSSNHSGLCWKGKTEKWRLTQTPYNCFESHHEALKDDYPNENLRMIALKPGCSTCLTACFLVIHFRFRSSASGHDPNTLFTSNANTLTTQVPPHFLYSYLPTTR